MSPKLLRKIIRLSTAAFISVFAVSNIYAESDIEYHASVTAQASSESLAPYMLGSWNEGRYVEGSGVWQEAGLVRPLDMSKRFSWSVGIGYIAGIGSKTDYDRWNSESESWFKHSAKMPNFRFTQLYGQLKYRSVFLTLGMKNSSSGIVDGNLSSGDLTRSNNAAPVPGIGAGFLDFQNIPFTNGWVQIDGEIMYGMMTDSGFKKAEFNYYSGVEALNLWYTYKRCYFRTNPEKPFHVTLGMQSAGLFAGSTYQYQKGKVVYKAERGFRFKDIFQMFLPMEGGEDYYTGSHLGSWDLKATYRFRNGSQLSAYFEWPWEDGSGIGKKNGWDGLWGLQYDIRNCRYINKAVIEYLDFTNQSGPIHYAPHDHPNAPISGQAEGADDYYNNDDYGAYTNYGMSIGTPFLLAPIYNTSGMLSYLHNRARGFHAAAEGSPSERLSYRVMVGYETAGGNGWVPAPRRLNSTSAMIEAKTLPLKNLPGLEVGLRIAFDKGSLRGDNFGAQIKIAYSGEFSIKKKSK